MTTTTPTTPGRAGSSKSSVRSLLPLSLLPLSRRARKAVLYLHILASVSWIAHPMSASMPRMASPA